MLYIRPSRRVKCPPAQCVGKPREGSFLHKLLATETTVVYKPPPKRPVYNQNDYLKLIEKNYKDAGLHFVKPDLPIHIHPEPPDSKQEPVIDVPDRVYMNLRILKSGIVRVKLSGTIWDLHEKYYKYAKKPPPKAIIQAYKGHGFSKEYMEQIKVNFEKQKQIAKRVEKVFAKIFEKEPVKKAKKKVEKKAEKKDDENIIDEQEPEEEENEDENEDDGGMDVEPDMEDEEVVEDEEFLSDGE